ncbi:hypothetical protein [Sorangium sp. So ce1151]|uniref:hypothetical protein n=1 Tax=Sorangium sp. So ce1151 TaxID=3133332 RepID=UPI003F602A69
MSGSVFMPTSISPSLSEPDPTKHVNYVLGMVLGVDDFTQEFAYLAGRDELAARELVGYGVARGLRVTSPTPPDATRGPEVVVSAGIAVTPRGRFVRVPLTQCAFVNDWIAKNRPALDARQVVVSDPLSLYVVLSYAEQTTDLVPIPGEPCRTEDESMAASRIADDFMLELRLDPPEQREQDAARAYLDWLATVPVVDTGGTELPAFLAAIEDAAGKTPIGPSSTTIFADPPPAVTIPRSDAARYLREAIRLFATLRAEWAGAGATPDGTPPNEGAVLLGRIDLTLELESVTSSTWKVKTIAIDETQRVRLLSLAYLQEVMLALADRAAKQASVTLQPGTTGLRYLVAGAGTVQIKKDETDASTEDPPTYNGLTAWAIADGVVTVKLAGPASASLQYIVKALPVAETGAIFGDPTVAFGAFLTPEAGDGARFTLLVKNSGAAVPLGSLVGLRLMIEVSAFGTG